MFDNGNPKEETVDQMEALRELIAGSEPSKQATASGWITFFVDELLNELSFTSTEGVDQLREMYSRTDDLEELFAAPAYAR